MERPARRAPNPAISSGSPVVVSITIAPGPRHGRIWSRTAAAAAEAGKLRNSRRQDAATSAAELAPLPPDWRNCSICPGRTS